MLTERRSASSESAGCSLSARSLRRNELHFLMDESSRTVSSSRDCQSAAADRLEARSASRSEWVRLSSSAFAATALMAFCRSSASFRSLSSSCCLRASRSCCRCCWAARSLSAASLLAAAAAASAVSSLRFASACAAAASLPRLCCWWGGCWRPVGGCFAVSGRGSTGAGGRTAAGRCSASSAFGRPAAGGRHAGGKWHWQAAQLR